MKKVLIAYGTRFGTTQDTSEKVRDFLAEKDIEVSLVNLKDNEPTLSGFDGVLIGTGIKISMWAKTTKKFIKKHKEELQNRKFLLGVFVSCGTASDKDKIKEAKQKYIEKKLHKIGLNYDISEAFGPIYDFSETSIMGNMNKKMMKAGLKDEGWEEIEDIRYDLRDMEQIKKFAENFATLL